MTDSELDEKLTRLATVIRTLERKLSDTQRDADTLRDRLDQLEPRMDAVEGEVM